MLTKKSPAMGTVMSLEAAPCP